MSDNSIFDKDFEKIDFSKEQLPAREFDNCTFIECTFKKVDISNCNFVDCRFVACDLSLVQVYDTGFKSVLFESCKMIGIDFQNCSNFLFSLEINNSQLSMSSFIDMSLKSSIFNHCLLQEVDFTDADLRGSVFNDCDFNRAIFLSTRMQKMDFRTNMNYSIQPEMNSISGAKFSLTGVKGLLHTYNIIVE